MDEQEIVARLKEARVPHARIAAAIGRAQPQATRLLKGERSLKANEVQPLLALLGEYEDDGATIEEYVAVEVLPTYAGMGGGGNGEDSRRFYKVRRELIEHELRGKPGDFIIVPTRGDSMEPDFFHGDDVLCDKRDTSPAQPGPFALWDGEWGEYVVKNVERTTEGRVRVFSTNTKYTPTEVESEQTRIIGRPVWVARRL